jgi:hypothetical protein
MTDSPATYSKQGPTCQEPRAAYYMSFRFLKLEPDYHRLITNEKVQLKQDFLNSFDQLEDKLKISTYAMTGLAGDADILMWKVTRHLKDLNAMSAQIQSVGIGSYLKCVRSMLGLAACPPWAKTEEDWKLGQHPYLVVLPGTIKDASSLKPMQTDYMTSQFALDSYSDSTQYIVALDVEDPRRLPSELAAHKVMSVGDFKFSSSYTCLRASMSEILDSLG